MHAPRQPLLKVTQRRGKLLAAYCYLGGRPGQRSHRTRRIARGLVADFARNGSALGVEITAPRSVTRAALNRAIHKLGWPTLDVEEFGPLAGERHQPAGPRSHRAAPPPGGRVLGALPTTETTYTIWRDGLSTIVHRNGPSVGPVARGTSPGLERQVAEIDRRKARAAKHWKQKRRKSRG